MRILHAHHAALDADDAIGRVAELEDVTGEAFDGEILVDRADDHVFWLEQDLEIGIVRDRAAGGDRREPRPAPPAQAAVDLVAMDQRAPPSAPRGEAVGEHAQHRCESLARKIAVRPSAPDERESSASSTPAH